MLEEFFLRLSESLTVGATIGLGVALFFALVGIGAAVVRLLGGDR